MRLKFHWNLDYFTQYVILMGAMLPRWERRVDPRGRVYYVDHNTRTTTWQKPNPDMMNNLHQWQQWRQNRTAQWEQLAQRFLFPQAQQQDNDPLGPLPEGWGELGIRVMPASSTLQAHCVGNPPVDSPHKGPVMWKGFSWHDVIMRWWGNCQIQGLSEEINSIAYAVELHLYSSKPLTHCGLVTPYGSKDLSQHWLR